MKKLLAIFAALCLVYAAQASVVLSESFDRTPGTLSAGDVSAMENDNDNWFTYTTASTKPYLQVVEQSLTYAGYQSEASGNALAFSGDAYTDLRGFSSNAIAAITNSSKVFVGFLLNVATLKTNTEYFLALNSDSRTSTTAGKQYARVYMEKADDSHFKLGVGKCTDNKNASYMNYSAPLSTGETHLIIIEYEKIAGDNNDSIRLYIDPTKTEPGTYYLTTWSFVNTNQIEQGSKKAADADSFYNITLRPSSSAAVMTLDELRVATNWGDLFEGGSSSAEPAIGANPSVINLQDVYTGEPVTQDISITADNLTEDIIISHQHSDIVLSANRISATNAITGATLTVTLNPTAEGAQQETITLTSGNVVRTISLTWSTSVVTEYNTLSAMKAAAEAAEEYSALMRYTGTAIVTRDTVISGVHELYIEDATAAMRVSDDYDLWSGKVAKGDQLTAFRALNASGVLGIYPLFPVSLPQVLSHGNSVTPQAVTLAQLQAAPQDYLLELVTLSNVTLDNSAGTFSAGEFAMTQDNASATLKIEMGTGLTGKAIPALANVTGFVFNRTATIIVPRGYSDVEDATPQPLLRNGGFEQYEVSSFMGTQWLTYTDWTFPTAAGLTTEAQNKIEGDNALKTTSNLTMTGTLYQSVALSKYNTDDEFKLRMRYKVLTDQGDGTLTLNCYWASATTGELNHDAAILKNVALPNSDEWQLYEVTTTKPADAVKFEFCLTIQAQAIVLLDDFAFEYIEPTEYFSVSPERVQTVQTNINEAVTAGIFTVRQRGLTQPVLIEITGHDAAMFSADKTQVTADGEKVTVTYLPTAVGHHEAFITFVDDETQTTTLCNTVRSLQGTAIDPTQQPLITINPTSLPHFTCDAMQYVYDTIEITSSNCIDDVFSHVTHITGSAFVLLDYSLPRNTTRKAVVQFHPVEEGEYSSELWWTTEGGETVRMVVNGTANPAGTTIDYATEFVWDASAPLDLLNETFDDADEYHNRTYDVPEGWQNVVTQGTRAWLGFHNDTTVMAKATGYLFGVDVNDNPLETWLVTPALNFQTPNAKQFGFKVMGEFLHEEQRSHLQLWYIDPAGAVEEHIADVDNLIPAGDAELSGQWVPIIIDLSAQTNIADVFYMAFRFAGYLSPDCGEVYYIDDVTWGVELQPTTGMPFSNSQPATTSRKLLRNGQVLILRGDKTYTLLGIETK